MPIQIDDHTLVADPRAHLMRAGFSASPVGGGMIEVSPPRAIAMSRPATRSRFTFAFGRSLTRN
jgi:hypothetical protein